MLDFSDFVAILPWIVAVFRGVAVLVIGPRFCQWTKLDREISPSSDGVRQQTWALNLLERSYLSNATNQKCLGGLRSEISPMLQFWYGSGLSMDIEVLSSLDELRSRVLSTAIFC